MATLSPSLAASELFGHVRGAFTGADRNHIGCFVRCEGGTLFLDEIGETPTDTQAQLLRVLETRDVRPVGGSAAKTVDVRVIAATDADLEGAVRQGDFREALLQRLAGFRIVVPPLRERRVDIGPLIYHFARLELASVGMAGLLDTSPEEQAADPSSVDLRHHRRAFDRLSLARQRPRASQTSSVSSVIAGRRHAEMSLGSDLDVLLRPNPSHRHRASPRARIWTPSIHGRATAGAGARSHYRVRPRSMKIS